MSETKTIDVLKDVWMEADRIRKMRKRRYGLAALAISAGLFLFNFALALFLSGSHIAFLDTFLTYIVLALSGSLAFGYGFYLMGVK
ncbi:MAG: hypothetical protein ACTSUS_02655 [Candidatus Freyarchaeota archaeon]